MMRDLSSLAVTPASAPVTSCLQGWLADLICLVVRVDHDIRSDLSKRG
jgi:hypothetical protein